MSDQLPIHVLVVDDQQSAYQLCAAMGRDVGVICTWTASFKEALARVESSAPDLVLADLTIGNNSGLELLTAVRSRWPRTAVALMSSCATIESAVEAMRQGAFDFAIKPLRGDTFKPAVDRIVQRLRIARNAERQNERAHSDARTDTLLPSPILCTDLEELERLTVQRVFEQVAGNKEKAQKLLGISRATLYRKIKRYGIQTRQEVREESFAAQRNG